MFGLFICLFIYFCIGSPVAQADFKLSMSLRMMLNSSSSLPQGLIKGRYHFTQQKLVFATSLPPFYSLEYTVEFSRDMTGRTVAH